MAATFLQGLDVSHFNNTIARASVAQDPSRPAFAYAKTSDGCTMADPCFAANYAGIRASNILRGAYHFFRPDQSALDQANWFIGIVGSVSGDLPPMLDVETAAADVSMAQYADAIRRWLDQVGTKFHCTPIIYTSANFWNTNLGDFSAFAGHPLWIAEYCSAAAPLLPKGASTYALWQYSESGTIAGIDDTVDLDRFNGSAAQLRALVCGAPRALHAQQ